MPQGWGKGKARKKIATNELVGYIHKKPVKVGYFQLA